MAPPLAARQKNYSMYLSRTHFTPQHWLLCHVGLNKFEFEFKFEFDIRYEVMDAVLSSAAAGAPDSSLARFAEIFPFSSPFAMAARAANAPELWPHLVALGWQGLWVAITIWITAGLFRRGVLKSGPGLLSFLRRKR